MRSVLRSAVFTVVGLLLSAALAAQGSWVQQPTALPSNPSTFVQVGGLWGIAMTDTGTGFAAGYASVGSGFSGVLRKLPGNPTWFVLPSSSFPGLAPSHSLWSGVSAVGTNAWVCGSNARLYRTTDNGNNWASATSGITTTSSLFDIFFKSQNEGMVVGNNGNFYYTSDGGTNWTAQTLPGTVTATTALYAVHSAGNVWYVSGENNTLIKGTPQTSSTSWTDLTANVPSLGIIEGLQFFDDVTGNVAGSLVSGHPLYRTTNSGTSFSGIGTGLPGGQAYNTLFFFNANHGWSGNGPNSLYETTNAGQNWTLKNTAPLPSQTLNNWLTRIDFASTTIGYASGGAPGTTSTGWILRYETTAAADISTTDTTMDFGTLECDSSTLAQFTINNSGTAALSISSITFNSPAFSLAGPLPTPIPPNGGATITVRWTPPTAGPIPSAARMTIASNDAANPVWDVALHGLYNRGTFAIADNYAFPDACIGDTSKLIVNVLITGNLNPELINFTHVSGDDVVTLASPGLGTTLSGTSQLVFHFAPANGGAKSGVYQLVYGNPLCPQTTLITFTGTAFETKLTLNPMVVDFGDVCIGEMKEMEVTVSNTGSTNAMISLRMFSSGRNVFPNMHPTPFGPITPGNSQQYSVRFAPTGNDSGLVEGVYKLIVDPCKDTLLLTLRGRAVNPLVSFIPTTVLAIGPTPTGNIIEEQVEIHNDGNATLTLSAITLNPPHPRLTLINLPPLPMTLPAGQMTTVTVQFAPDRTESITTSLCAHWSDPCADSSCLSVGATSGDEPTIVVATAHDVGLQRCDPEILDTLWVYNTGKGTLLLQNFLLAGANPTHFSVRAPATPHSVVTGDSVAVIIAYRAPANGTSSAELTITHNDSKANRQSVVQLTGERKTVEFAVEGDTLTPYISCARVGSSRSLTIRNLEVAQLEVRDIAIINGGDVFHVASTPLPSMIPGGSGLNFEINFTPSGKGLFSGIAQITVGPCDDTYLIYLEGEGNITEFAFDPDPVNFGPVTIGSPATRNVKVTNTGVNLMRITAAYFNPGIAELSIVSPPSWPVDISPGRSRDFTVRFDPASVQTIAAGLCFAVTAPCPDTLCVDVTGRGASTGIGLTRTRMEFQLDPCSQAEFCDTVAIVNNAGQEVTVNTVRLDPPTGFRAELPGTLPLTLGNGESVTVRICADGNFTGSRVSNLVVESNDTNTPVLRMPVTVRRDSSGFQLAETVVDFGAIMDCQIGISRLVTVTNTGTLVEFVDTLRRNEAFLITTSVPVALQPSAITQVRVTFAPPRYGVFEDTLFLTSPRCNALVPMIVRGELHETNFEVTPVPLVFTDVAVGSSDTRNFTFTNLELPSVRIADVQITPAGSEFASWGAYPKNVGENGSTDLPILYNPQSPGVHNATACIIIDQPCPDTLCVPIRGSTSTGAISAHPNALLFGRRAQCESTELRDTIRNSGTVPVTLTASRIEGADAALFTISNPVTAPEILDPGNERVFLVAKVANTGAAVGTKWARLVVETGSSTQPELTVPINMDLRILELPDEVTLDFGIVYTGTPYPRRILLRNPGSMPLSLSDPVSVPDLTLDTALPLLIGANSEDSLNVTFTPTTAGMKHDTLILRTSPCGWELRIIILADVREGLNMDPADFGIVANCTSTRQTFTLNNALTENAIIEAISISGADAAFFTLIDPTVFPVSIDGASELDITLDITPDPATERAYEAELVFAHSITGGTREFSIPVSAESRRPLLTLTQPIDFGDVSFGSTSQPLAVQFRNTLPFPIRVGSIDPVSAPFRITSVTPTLPAVIPPGGLLTLTMEFSPPQTGEENATLMLRYSDPCALQSDHDITGRGIDDWLRATLSIEEHEGRVDDIIDVPIFLNTDLGSADVWSWEGVLSFNGSMLHPLDIITAGTLSSNMQASLQYSAADGRLTLSGAGAALGAGSGTLVTLRFKVLVGEALETPLAIEPGFAFTSGHALVESTSDGRFTLVDYCDADGKRLVGAAPMIKLQANRPNPFAARTEFSYEISQGGRVRLGLFDQSGRELRVLVSGDMPAGEHHVTLDGGGLAPGIYFAVLRSHGQTVVRKLLRMQ